MVEGGVTAAERSYDAELRSHRHVFHQVLFPSLGRMALGFGEESGYVGNGRLAFVAAGIEHSYRADGPNRVLVADLPAGLDQNDASAELLTGVGPGVFLSLDARLTALAAALRTEVCDGGLDDPLVADALGHYLVAALRRAGDRVQPRGSSPSSRRLARAAEEYLRAHYAQSLSVAEIAAAVGASPAHLHRCFREHAGTSIVAFVHQLRLAQAAELLSTTDLSVLEITHAVGFASQSHLSRLFARHFGCPPGRYRAGA
jgi:AraC-like DNA-binding protein